MPTRFRMSKADNAERAHMFRVPAAKRGLPLTNARAELIGTDTQNECRSQSVVTGPAALC